MRTLGDNALGYIHTLNLQVYIPYHNMQCCPAQVYRVLDYCIDIPYTVQPQNADSENLYIQDTFPIIHACIIFRTLFVPNESVLTILPPSLQIPGRAYPISSVSVVQIPPKSQLDLPHQLCFSAVQIPPQALTDILSSSDFQILLYNHLVEVFDLILTA